MSRVRCKSALLGSVVLATSLARWSFIGAPSVFGQAGNVVRRPAVQRHSLAGNTCSAYCQEYARYVDNQMFLTAAVRLAARQDILMTELEAGTQKTSIPAPKNLGEMELHLREQEEKWRQPRVKEMKEELFEVADMLRAAMQADLKDKGMTTDMISDLVAHVEVMDKERRLGSDIAGVGRLLRMATVCKGRKVIDMSDLEKALEEEDNSVLSAFQSRVSGTPQDPGLQVMDQGALDELQEFLDTVGPEFAGKAYLVLDAVGVRSLQELLDLVDERSDLADLDKEEVDMKVLQVKKLFKAILNEKEKRS